MEGRQHKAKPSHTGRKYNRNFVQNRPGDRNRTSGITKYVARAKRKGTYKVRKSRSKR